MNKTPKKSPRLSGLRFHCTMLRFKLGDILRSLAHSPRALALTAVAIPTVVAAGCADPIGFPVSWDYSKSEDEGGEEEGVQKGTTPAAACAKESGELELEDPVPASEGYDDALGGIEIPKDQLTTYSTAKGHAYCSNEPKDPVCGNGITEIGEQCDDRNNLDGDGCSAICVLEPEPEPDPLPEPCGVVTQTRIHITYSPKPEDLQQTETCSEICWNQAVHSDENGQAKPLECDVDETLRKVKDGHPIGDADGVDDVILEAGDEATCIIPGTPCPDEDEPTNQ